MLIQGLNSSILNPYGYLSIVAENIGKITLKVLDTANGRMAKKISEEIISGVQQLTVNIGDLANGTYIVNLFNGDVFIKSFKVIKQ